MWILVVLIIAVVGLTVLAYWQTARAKRQHEAKVALSPARVAAIVNDAFGGLFWGDVSGPATINKRRKSINGNGATISVDIQPLDDGTTHVVVWMSAWKSNGMGLALAGGVTSVEKRILRRLEEA